MRKFTLGRKRACINGAQAAEMGVGVGVGVLRSPEVIRLSLYVHLASSFSKPQREEQGDSL